MIKSHHNNKNTNIKNSALEIVHVDKQQLLENDTNNYKMYNTLKFIKK